MSKFKTLLLYMHLVSPRPTSKVVNWVIYGEDVNPEIGVEDEESPYDNVIEALNDGWELIHLPDQRAPIDDMDLDIIGYEFVLQKRLEGESENG
jgi:hypothetical protein